ncbi:MAG: ACP S-malonyltransferase [Treponemataceae bacterium]|nr:ACP S-malonyltransferase [Treponemataceae bacterium]
MKNVFLFPGQGAQKKGMFLDICQKYPEAMKTVKLAEEIAEEAISAFMWEREEDELARSDRSQLAITTASLALAKLLASRGISPDLCAGFSLGEFSALCMSGVLSFEETIRVVKERGIIMQKACDALSAASAGSKPGMAAVIGLTPEQVEAAINPLALEGIAFPANLNSPKQTVISGTAAGLDKAETLCKEAGCRRFIKLKVAGPFHSPLMAEAAARFQEVLASVTFRNPEKRLFSNVTGKEISSGEEARKLAIKHFTHPVQWMSEEGEMAGIIDCKNENCSGEWRLFEVGPGSVLSGLWRDSAYSTHIACGPLNTVDSLAELFCE